MTNLINFIDQTVYANSDNGPEVVWTTPEVLELLAEIRNLATPQTDEDQLAALAMQFADEVISSAAADFEIDAASFLQMWAMIGQALTFARRPEAAPLPVEEMISRLHELLQQLAFAVIAHNAERTA